MASSGEGRCVGLGVDVVVQCAIFGGILVVYTGEMCSMVCSVGIE